MKHVVTKIGRAAVGAATRHTRKITTAATTAAATAMAKAPALAASGVLLGGGIAARKYLGHGDVKTPTTSGLSLGEVSADGVSHVLFVPGSISDANMVGADFVTQFEKEAGVRPRYINSQMDLSEYPDQIAGADSAKTRNERVERGIIGVIADSPDEIITIIGHSAGAKSALTAVRTYYREHPDSKKKVNILLAGAGSPDRGLSEDKDFLIRDKRVIVKETRNLFDVVPEIAGTSSDADVHYFASPTSLDVAKALQAHEHPEHGFNDDQPPRELITGLRALGDILKVHWYTEYTKPLAEMFQKVTQQRAAEQKPNAEELRSKSRVAKDKTRLLDPIISALKNANASGSVVATTSFPPPPQSHKIPKLHDAR